MIEKRVMTLEETVQDHADRLEKMEKVVGDIGDIKEILERIARYVRIAGPSVISAALAAGIVNGKLGAFLHALFGG